MGIHRKKHWQETKMVSPYRLAHGTTTPEEKLFCQLVVLLGYPACEAYQLSFRTSTANINSCAALASRLQREPSVRHYIDILVNKYYGNQHFISEKYTEPYE